MNITFIEKQSFDLANIFWFYVDSVKYGVHVAHGCFNPKLVDSLGHLSDNKEIQLTALCAAMPAS